MREPAEHATRGCRSLTEIRQDSLCKQVGSVGSEDTTDCGSDMEAAIGEVADATRAAGEAGDRTAEAVDQVR